MVHQHCYRVSHVVGAVGMSCCCNRRPLLEGYGA
jgi:hypothetical protein